MELIAKISFDNRNFDLAIFSDKSCLNKPWATCNIPDNTVIDD